MAEWMKTALSAARLLIVLALLVAASGGAVQASESEGGGCTKLSGSAKFCMAGDEVTAGAYCVPGQSGGCETCAATGVYATTCFSSGGMQHHYYTPTAPPGE